MTLQHSLSVVLAVYNAEQTLTEKIAKLLDILPDLTNRFEVLVIDQGSADQTLEVAHDLAREYPQIRVSQHLQRLDRSAIIETALGRASGELLFVQDEDAPIDSSKFQRLWAMRAGETVVVPLNKLRTRPSLMKRLAAWGIRIDEPRQDSRVEGLQMIRREPKVCREPRSADLSSRISSGIARADTAEQGLPCAAHLPDASTVKSVMPVG